MKHATNATQRGKALATALLACALLAACGGGSADADASNLQAAPPDSTNTKALSGADVESSASVVALEKVSETRISRTVFDYVYRITVKNGSLTQRDVVVTLSGGGAGTTIIEGEVAVGDLPANALVTPAGTVTIRQDRLHPFDPDALVWQIAGARHVTFDPALCRQQSSAPYAQTVGLTGTNVMVTSADAQASAAGCKALAAGGSAIDAAIAVQAVLGVAEPFASGIAGGSVITYYDAATKKVRTYDGLSAAPGDVGSVNGAPPASIYQAAVPDDTFCKSGLALGASLSSQQGNTNISGRAVGVPGTVAVLDLVHQAYGKKAWKDLWDDAITLAADGFPMTPYMYSTLYSDGSAEDDETGDPLKAGGVPAWFNSARTAWGAPRCKYADIKRRYCDPADPASEKPLPVGTLIKNPELAATMTLLRDGGAAAFYDPNGAIVASILKRFRADKFKAGTADSVTTVTSSNNNCYSTLPAASSYDPAAGTVSATITPARIPSLMSAADFAHYRAIERRPLIGTSFGMTIYTQPAPLFGGVVTLYTLGLLERNHVEQQPFGTPGFLHLAIDASRLANADRRNVVGDPAYSNVDARVQALLSPAYLDSRAALITGPALGTVPVGGAADGIPDFSATDPAGYSPLASLAVQRPGAMRLAQRSANRDEDWNTTSNLAIVDGYGNALSMTTTINTHWGAHIEAGGMLLNNALSNFSAGAVGSDVNGYAATKRPRSSISPSIAFDSAGRLRLVWGSAGGGPIPDYIVKTFLGNVVYGLDIQAAINADNWSGQDVSGSNPVGELESGKPIADLFGTMRSSYGYSSSTLKSVGLTSGLSGIAVEHDANGWPVYRGAADNRRNGAANGY